MPDKKSNVERLHEAGVLSTDDLPMPHHRAVESLTRNEVDVLIAVMRRLEAADDWAAVDPSVGDPPDHFSALMPY